MMNLNEKSHRIKILSTIFIIFIIYFQFVHPHFNNEKKSEYLYTELQKSHLENGRYKRDGILWTDRKSTTPLTGLVYDFAENGKELISECWWMVIKMGYGDFSMIMGYQIWKTFMKTENLSELRKDGIMKVRR